MKTHKNILLIEDDQDDQFLFKEVIKKCPEVTLVFIANNGREALDWLNTSTALPDLIFSDINMPLMNGIDCFREILNTPALCKLPVVFLSSDTTMIEYVGVLGAKTFIKKGIDDASLKMQIERVIRMDHFATLLIPVINLLETH
jgi:CheY-like chemotaxis protein